MENLRQTYYQFNRAISKIHLLGIINDTVFLDFPSNLPKIVQDKWREKTKKIIFTDGKSQGLDFSDYGFLTALLNVLPGENENSNFQQVILGQEFINYLAHLEALMQDVFRHVFKNNPDLLPEDKEIKWKEIVDKKSVEEIHDYVIDKHLEKSGYDKLSHQIEKLNNKPFLFSISIKKEKLIEIENLITIRNLILHNGSKITNDYLKLNPKSKFALNETIILTREEVNNAQLLINKVAYETYASICYKIHGIPKQNSYDEMSFTPDK